MHVVALALEERVWRDRDAQVEVASRSRGAGALAGDAHALATLHARRYLHIDLTARPLPASAAARGARLSLDVAGALTGSARFLEAQVKCLPRAVEGPAGGDSAAPLNL